VIRLNAINPGFGLSEAFVSDHRPDVRAQKPGELRIAVAMRGGVSLAVWMGGACSEIVRLRNASPDGDDPYSRLIRILGYDQVTVDVIAGTSAGGLNSALLALHLGYGMPFGDGVRDLWLQVGDLEQLTRSPSAPHPPSLLTGDEKDGFYGRLREACLQLLEQAPAHHHSAPNIRLVLTATRLHPRTVRVRQTLGEPLHASIAKAYFVFQHRAVNGTEPIITDFRPGEAKQVADLLAYAARTTSSFPGAFAPARIRVSPGEPDFTGPDFQHLSSETGAGDLNGATVELMDGGVLDNIPVAWAIRAIAGAPADRPVDRWLVYLQPVEPVTEEETVPPKERRVTRLVRLLLQTFSSRLDSESLLDDATELNTAATTARRVRGIAATGIPSAPSAVIGDDRRLAAYRRLVGLAEGNRLARLADDPSGVLGPDPLPLPGDRPRVVPEVLRGLAGPAVVADLAAGDDPADGIRTPFGVARAVALLLDWVRASEAAGQLLEHDSQVVRDQLFSARLAAELLVGVRERMILPHLEATTSAADVVELVRRATWRLTAAMPAGWRIPNGESWPAWRDLLFGILAQPLPAQVPDGWPTLPYAPFWDELTNVGLTIGESLDPGIAGASGFDALRTAAKGSPETAPESGNGPRPGTDQAPAGVGGSPISLAARPPEQVARMRRALLSAELLLGPVRADPFTEPTDVKFHAMTASRANPIEETVFRRRLKPKERADLKLSGNQLSNFAAFLSARWRHTDWTWGRLDAVPSLVELAAADQSRLERMSPEKLLEELRALYLSGPPEQIEVLAAQWAKHEVTAENVREKFTDVVVERLQRGVLTDELPVVEKLRSRGADRDLPPTPDDLAQLPPADLAKAPMIADVGSETLRHLLRRGHTRRTATRIGLVAWRAVQPAGTGIWANVARRAFGLVKPLLLLPVLASIASPLGAVAAAVGAWLLVAAVAGTWSSPLIQPLLAAGFALSFGMAAWRLISSRGWTIALWAVLGAAVPLAGGALLVGFGLNQVWDSDWLRYGAILLGAIAGIMPFGWLLASRTAGAWRLFWMFLLLLAAGLGGVGLSLLPAVNPVGALDAASGWLSGPLRGLVTLYAVLTFPTMLLTWAFPKPPASDHD
jgi:predicted acylesterase/phospholipase RssA